MLSRASLVLCLVLAFTRSAAAEASPYLERDNPLRDALPSAEAVQQRSTRRVEAQIERALATLPNVRRAEVIVIPASPLAALDQPLPQTRVNVRLEGAPGPSDAQVRALVVRVLPELSSERVNILRTPSPVPTHSLASRAVRVGPFQVAPETAPLLRVTLAACLGANAVLATLLLLRRRAR